MDLYESVIAVFPDKVRVLRAGPTDVTSREASRNDVVATILHTNLLVARWTLLLADGGALDVEYNAVSHPTIAEVDRYVLSHGAGDLKQPAAPVATSVDRAAQVPLLRLTGRWPSTPAPPSASSRSTSTSPASPASTSGAAGAARPGR